MASRPATRWAGQPGPRARRPGPAASRRWERPVERMSEHMGGPPPPPAAAEAVFGDRLPLAERFVALLCDSGLTHGLLGPREVPRVWDRHVLNCAVVGRLLPEGAEVIDVGSGAGLPGLALAVARPDCRFHLVEPMLRRTTWLREAVDQLELPQVQVRRGRAEELWGQLSAPVVTARAVARLARLAQWSLPLLQPDGELLAIKGSSAPAELAEDEGALRRLGAVDLDVLEVGAPEVDPPTTVVRITVGDRPATRSTSRGQRTGSPNAGRRRRAHR